MNKLIDLTGQKFSMLTVLEKTDSIYTLDKVKTMWLCRCDCGAIKAVNSSQIRKKQVKSCGSRECKLKVRGKV